MMLMIKKKSLWLYVLLLTVCMAAIWLQYVRIPENIFTLNAVSMSDLVYGSQKLYFNQSVGIVLLTYILRVEYFEPILRVRLKNDAYFSLATKGIIYSFAYTFYVFAAHVIFSVISDISLEFSMFSGLAKTAIFCLMCYTEYYIVFFLLKNHFLSATIVCLKNLAIIIIAYTIEFYFGTPTVSQNNYFGSLIYIIIETIVANGALYFLVKRKECL
ncbi:MAG TPA: hypothetical protein DCY15_05080 [Ruminococcaceae bacterium]|nr:hypothetical protein [Oscillospiraceae bacterium]